MKYAVYVVCSMQYAVCSICNICSICSICSMQYSSSICSICSMLSVYYNIISPTRMQLFIVYLCSIALISDICSKHCNPTKIFDQLLCFWRLYAYDFPSINSYVLPWIYISVSLNLFINLCFDIHNFLLLAFIYLITFWFIIHSCNMYFTTIFCITSNILLFLASREYRS